MSLAGRVNWLLFGASDEECDEALSFIVDRLEALKKLEKKVQALEIRHEELRGRTLGWQEGFGGEMRKALKRIDERIAKLLESDDSADFEIRQWIEEMQALRKQVKSLSDFALETRTMIPERPKGVLSRYLEDSIKKEVHGD